MARSFSKGPANAALAATKHAQQALLTVLSSALKMNQAAQCGRAVWYWGTGRRWIRCCRIFFPNTAKEPALYNALWVNWMFPKHGKHTDGIPFRSLEWCFFWSIDLLSKMAKMPSILLLLFLHLNFISSVALSMNRDSVAFSNRRVPEFWTSNTWSWVPSSPSMPK